MTPILQVHLVHASSFSWSPSCSFTFVALYVLFWCFHDLCCVRVYHAWYWSLDNILQISAKIFRPLVTPSRFNQWNAVKINIKRNKMHKNKSNMNDSTNTIKHKDNRTNKNQGEWKIGIFQSVSWSKNACRTLRVKSPWKQKKNRKMVVTLLNFFTRFENVKFESERVNSSDKYFWRITETCNYMNENLLKIYLFLVEVL